MSTGKSDGTSCAYHAQLTPFASSTRTNARSSKGMSLLAIRVRALTPISLVIGWATMRFVRVLFWLRIGTPKVETPGLRMPSLPRSTDTTCPSSLSKWK